MLCVHRHPVLDSTNDEAIHLAREGAPEGTVVWAEEQIRGRGQAGHSWESPRGNLFLSVILRPCLASSLIGRLGIACGLSAARALRHLTGFPVRTKWPNDLYLHGCKIGGVLVEARQAPGAGLDWAVVGLGVNVASCPSVPPPGHPATCLADHGWAGAPETLMEFLAQNLQDDAATVGMEDRWISLIWAWESLDHARGPVRLVRDGAWEEGEGISLDRDGALLVRRASGLMRVASGEVSVRIVS